MEVNNIFNLVNKFSNKEDQISASFGFILKTNPKLLDKFLKKLSLNLTKKELKKVDIETQATYDSGESRIDLQLRIYNNFLIFLESKLFRNEKNIIKQLKKYSKILKGMMDEYAKKIKLVYINKHPIDNKIIKEIRKRLKLKQTEFYFLSWEDLIKLTEEYSNKDIIKLFKGCIGDTMYSKKMVKEQKMKELVEVLVIHTNVENWDLITKKHIAVQKNGSPDAQYIAFYRTHRKDKKGKKLRQAITHIAEVISTETNVKRSETVKGVPRLRRWYNQRGTDLFGRHKHYNLGKIVKLSREIPFIKGGKPIGQVKFKTKMSELLRVNNISELKKLSCLDD